MTVGCNPYCLTRRDVVAMLGPLFGSRLAETLNLSPIFSAFGSESLDVIRDTVEDASERLALSAVVKSLTLEQKISQLIVVKPEVVQGYGTVLEVGDDLRNALRERPIGGTILKDANFVNPDQVRTLTAGLQECTMEACGLPMLIGVDEEGGTVVRVADKAAFGVTDPGNMRAVGQTGDVGFAESEAQRVGAYLLDLGINMDFAPVADVTSDQSNFIYWRSFGGDAYEVADMVAAQVRGFASSQVLCTPKHFPGIGGARGDSHIQSIYSDRTIDEMLSWELVPFIAALEAGAPIVMVGHMTCTAIDAERPASMSPVVVGELLRNQLGFDGVVITDSLGMAAVNELYAPYDIGVKALEAGCDLLLGLADWRATFDGIAAAVREGRLSEDRIDESVERIVRLKQGLL
jgi:beta-N-acetylhexosaminidase